MTSTGYHHGNLREALVEAAVEAARANGPEGVGIRDLARQVGVSHNAAYRHFAQREDLLVEVSTRAMQALVDAMERRLATVEDPDPVVGARRRLTEIGRAYVAFALDEPGLFRIAFTSHPGMGQTTLSDLSVRPYTLLGEALDGLVDVGFLAPEARVDAEMTCWSAVHGFALLNGDAPLRDTPPAERELALDRVLAAIDRSYAATTGSVIQPGDVFADF